MRVVLQNAPLLLLGIALIGCGKEKSGTAGSSGQPQANVDPSLAVQLNIPSMHGAVGGPKRVREALATLPWVEQDSIQADVPSRKVTFAVKDKDKFDFEAVKNALNEQNFNDVELVSGPGKPAKKT